MTRTIRMTPKDIAVVCTVHESTVRRWVDKAARTMPSAARKMLAAGHGRAALFDLDETIAIIRAGGNETLASLLDENAKRVARAERSRRIPNGKQLELLIRIYGPAAAARRVDFVLGFSERFEIVDPEEGRRRLSELRDELKNRRQLELYS